jgi:hypothetical protein
MTANAMRPRAKGHLVRSVASFKHKEALLRARDAAERNYSKHHNVLGISAGTKFKKQTPTDNHLSIQFYVRRKRRPDRIALRLPRFVFGRLKNGKVDRRVKFETDIIEVGDIAMACGSGSKVKALGETGAITLLFRNKAAGDDGNFYLVTCAHVVGDLERSPPVDPDLESPCREGGALSATTIANSTSDHGEVIYDIALARLSPDVSPKPPDLAVADEALTLKGFFPEERIEPSLDVKCALPASRVRSGTVRSFAATFEVILDGRPYKVKNVYAMDAPVEPGDSGGLIYRDNLALGIVFARSTRDGWAWFQPIAGAFQFLQRLSAAQGLTVTAFEGRP